MLLRLSAGDLYAGAYNLGRLRDEGKAAQAQLLELHTLITEMCKQIRDHSSPESRRSAQEWGKLLRKPHTLASLQACTNKRPWLPDFGKVVLATAWSLRCTVYNEATRYRGTGP